MSKKLSIRLLMALGVLIPFSIHFAEVNWATLFVVCKMWGVGFITGAAYAARGEQS